MSRIPPEILLAVFMLGALVGLGICCLIEWRQAKRWRQRDLDAATDAQLRRGMRALTEREVDELLTPRYTHVQPRDFVIRDRNGQPIHFEDDRHGAA